MISFICTKLCCNKLYFMCDCILESCCSASIHSFVRWKYVSSNIWTNFPPFLAAMFSKAPANAARFSALFAIMRCIVAHIGSTSLRLEEPPKITPVDCASGIAVFRYCWMIQKVVVKKVVPLSPVANCTTFHGRQSPPKNSMQLAEKNDDDAMRQIRRYCIHNIQSASIWICLFMSLSLFPSRYIAFCGQTCLAIYHILSMPTLLQRRIEV